MVDGPAAARVQQGLTPWISMGDIVSKTVKAAQGTNTFTGQERKSVDSHLNDIKSVRNLCAHYQQTNASSMSSRGGGGGGDDRHGDMPMSAVTPGSGAVRNDSTVRRTHQMQGSDDNRSMHSQHNSQNV